MEKFSYLGNADPQAIESLYKQYISDPQSVSPDWQNFFRGFEFSQTYYPDSNHISEKESRTFRNEFKVIDLINAYRQRGHLFTKTNPVRTRRQYRPTLDHQNFGLNDEDLDHEFQAGNEIGIGKASLKKIIKHLQQTYCQSVGVEYRYIRTPEIVEWLKTKMESSRNTPDFSADTKKQILKKLTEAVGFEHFIRKRFPGQKRFSLEGGETLIPALDAVIELGAESGIKEFIIGMAHRGRLNVLGNILHKPYNKIFSEFAGMAYEDETLLGDVKYHLGCTLETETAQGKKINVNISPNPSHLEAVNPVVEGISRAKADQKYDRDLLQVAPILIHGDASIAGQGIVYEVVQMSRLPAYKTGGTIHLVINNQLGFTTNYLDGRSSTYCTDVAKTIQSPVFHVNGDDVEAVVYTIKLAMQFRQKFQRDVFIDLLSYRKYGHNESDEPRFTQPILYKIIEKHPDPATLYIEKLIQEGVISHDYARGLQDTFNEILDKELDKAKKIEKGDIDPFLENTWKGFLKPDAIEIHNGADTRMDKETLLFLGKKITELPNDKTFYRKTIRLMEGRRKMIEEGSKLDWAMGELMAYASLVHEGTHVRISGQDVVRGTFSHRHAVLLTEDTAEGYSPLNHISEDQAPFEIYNSLLSEYGVVGFEYGYAMASPQSLVIWEAQFGDFVNGAQIIIDQFISSAEEKWRVMNGMVMLLPHGFEGQGPEHSSARMERFLSSCAENNMQIVNCTTPANLYHVLRRQMKRHYRKPLVIFSPKSLLRHPKCTSTLDELAQGSFQPVIDDKDARPEQIDRVLICSGKVFYELKEYQENKKYNNTAIIRLEQLYPVPEKELRKLKEKYKNASRWLWVQEEPKNMGAWYFIQDFLDFLNPGVIARPPSGSPASGSSKFHAIQQNKIIEKAFEDCNCENVCRECKQLCISHLNQFNTV
ncbi:MAG: 2-oxoglutarate dehydrogenase E1 component [Bacteroidales bacterium]